MFRINKLCNRRVESAVSGREQQMRELARKLQKLPHLSAGYLLEERERNCSYTLVDAHFEFTHLAFILPETHEHCIISIGQIVFTEDS